MNFYFYMHMGCPLQDSYTPPQFIEQLGLAAAIQADERVNAVDPENPRPGDGQRLIPVRLDGAERMIRRAELCEMHEDFLGTARLHCMHCPVNKTPLPLACVGMLALPLGERAERWLLEQFAPPEPENSAVAALLHASRFPAAAAGLPETPRETLARRVRNASGNRRAAKHPGSKEVQRVVVTRTDLCQPQPILPIRQAAARNDRRHPVAGGAVERQDTWTGETPGLGGSGRLSE
jgi:hypothetical protein